MYDARKNFKDWYHADMEVRKDIRGDAAESRLIEAWGRQWKNRQPHVQWFIDIMRTERGSVADNAKIDAILYTKFDQFDFISKLDSRYPNRFTYRKLLPPGAIPLQVKSSVAGAIKNKLAFLPIPSIVINDNVKSKKEIRDRTLKEIIYQFPELELEFYKVGCKVSPNLVIFQKGLALTA